MSLFVIPGGTRILTTRHTVSKFKRELDFHSLPRVLSWENNRLQDSAELVVLETKEDSRQQQQQLKQETSQKDAEKDANAQRPGRRHHRFRRFRHRLHEWRFGHQNNETVEEVDESTYQINTITISRLHDPAPTTTLVREDSEGTTTASQTHHSRLTWASFRMSLRAGRRESESPLTSSSLEQHGNGDSSGETGKIGGFGSGTTTGESLGTAGSVLGTPPDMVR